jgi:hypothetical protein
MVLGIIYMLYLRARHPDRLAQTGRIFLDEPERAVAAGPGVPDAPRGDAP